MTQTATEQFNNLSYGGNARLVFRPDPPFSATLNARFTGVQHGVQAFADGEQPFVTLIFEGMDDPAKGQTIYTQRYFLQQIYGPQDGLPKNVQDRNRIAAEEFETNNAGLLGPEWAEPGVELPMVLDALNTLAEVRPAAAVSYSAKPNPKNAKYPYTSVKVLRLVASK